MMVEGRGVRRGIMNKSLWMVEIVWWGLLSVRLHDLEAAYSHLFNQGVRSISFGLYGISTRTHLLRLRYFQGIC